MSEIYQTGIQLLRTYRIKLRGRSEAKACSSNGPNEGNTRPAESLSIAEFKFLSDVLCHPISGTVERNKRLGLSASTASRLKANAIKENLLHEYLLAAKGKGRPKAALEPTNKLLGILKVELKGLKGQGSFLHRYLQEILACFLKEKGFQAKIEYDLNGKRCDVGYRTKNGKHIAYEIELSDVGDNNLKKDLAAGYDKVVVLCADRKLFQKLEGNISASIEVRFITEVL
jgi:hypothetical protein